MAQLKKKYDSGVTYYKFQPGKLVFPAVTLAYLKL
jgi:hypothetical protein